MSLGLLACRGCSPEYHVVRFKFTSKGEATFINEVIRAIVVGAYTKLGTTWKDATVVQSIASVDKHIAVSG